MIRFLALLYIPGITAYGGGFPAVPPQSPPLWGQQPVPLPAQNQNPSPWGAPVMPQDNAPPMWGVQSVPLPAQSEPIPSPWGAPVMPQDNAPPMWGVQSVPLPAQSEPIPSPWGTPIQPQDPSPSMQPIPAPVAPPPIAPPSMAVQQESVPMNPWSVSESEPLPENMDLENIEQSGDQNLLPVDTMQWPENDDLTWDDNNLPIRGSEFGRGRGRSSSEEHGKRHNHHRSRENRRQRCEFCRDIGRYRHGDPAHIINIASGDRCKRAIISCPNFFNRQNVVAVGQSPIRPSNFALPNGNNRGEIVAICNTNGQWQASLNGNPFTPTVFSFAGCGQIPVKQNPVLVTNGK